MTTQVPVQARKGTYAEVAAAGAEMLREKPRVMVAVPNLGTMDTRLVMKLLRWQAMPTNWDELTIVAPIGHIPHDSARNYCVEQFLDTDCTHLLFLDSDVVPPVDALELLLAAGKDAISGLYPSEWFDNEDGFIKKRQNVFADVRPDGDLVEAVGKGVLQIKTCGGGCLLLSRKAVEAVEPPWFLFAYTERGQMKTGEDIYFGRELEAAGIPLYAHMGVQCQHVKTVIL